MLPSFEHAGSLVIEQDDTCAWNELAISVDGRTVVVHIDDFDAITYFLYTALHGIRMMKSGAPCPPTWKGKHPPHGERLQMREVTLWNEG